MKNVPCLKELFNIFEEKNKKHASGRELDKNVDTNLIFDPWI